MYQALIVLIVYLISGCAACAEAQERSQRGGSAPSRSRIYKLEELTWPEIDTFDRQRTLFILPVGMIEEHGPHLPVGADTLGVMYEAHGASRRVSRASIERRADQGRVLFGRRAVLVRLGCSCRCGRNIGHARCSTGSGSFELQNAAEPSGALCRGVARNRDCAWLARVSFLSCESDGSARPGSRGMVD